MILPLWSTTQIRISDFFSLQAGKEVWDVDESMKYWWSSYCPYWKQAFGYIESEDHILGLDQKVLMNSGLIGVEH